MMLELQAGQARPRAMMQGAFLVEVAVSCNHSPGEARAPYDPG